MLIFLNINVNLNYIFSEFQNLLSEIYQGRFFTMAHRLCSLCNSLFSKLQLPLTGIRPFSSMLKTEIKHSHTSFIAMYTTYFL